MAEKATRARHVVSLELLERVKIPVSPTARKRIKDNFSLGMGEWEEWSSSDDDFQQPVTKKKTKRFAEPTTSEALSKSSEGVVPTNTKKNDRWSERSFNDWITERNEQCDDMCPVNILETEDAECLAKWLSLFVIEIRKKDGSCYPPATIHMLLCGLQRIMNRKKTRPFNIFSKNDVRFRSFHGTMESVFQSLHKKGIGAEVKHTEVISNEEEALIWSKGIIGSHSPRALLRAVFYLNGKNFCLRGGQEHRNLKLSQFHRGPDHWKYIENGSKCYRGGVADLRRENKVVHQFLDESNPLTCHVKLLDIYIEKLPPQAKQKDFFYFTPLKKKPLNPGHPWFSSVPVGWNTLDKMVKDIFLEAGVKGKTNHSLRVTGATRMYEHGIQEKTIQSRTGHKSVEALRVYERPSTEQHKEACKALSNVTNKSEKQPVPMCNAPAHSIPSQPPVFNFNGCSVNIYTGPFMRKDESSTNVMTLTQQEIANFENFD